MKHQVKVKANGLEFSATSNWAQESLGVKTPGRLILLLHGFPDDRTTWNAVWPLLEEAYPQALIVAPSMRGYEPSTYFRQDNEYSQTEIASDVAQFITTLGKRAPAYIIGHDWGAIAAFKTAQLYPEIVTKMVTLAIPYLANIPAYRLALQFPQQLWLSSYMLTMQVPRLYRSRFTQEDSDGHNPYLKALWEYWSPGWKFTDEEIGEVYKTLQQPGVIDSTTAYYRQMFKDVVKSPRGSRWIVDFDKVPTLLIGGAKDGCMTVKLFEYEAEVLGKNNVVIVKDAGHFLQREKPEEVANLIIDYLNSN